MLELTEAAAQHLGGVLRAAPQLPSEGPAQAECAQLDRRYRDTPPLAASESRMTLSSMWQRLAPRSSPPPATGGRAKLPVLVQPL